MNLLLILTSLTIQLVLLPYLPSLFGRRRHNIQLFGFFRGTWLHAHRLLTRTSVVLLPTEVCPYIRHLTYNVLTHYVACGSHFVLLRYSINIVVLLPTEPAAHTSCCLDAR